MIFFVKFVSETRICECVVVQARNECVSEQRGVESSPASDGSPLDGGRYEEWS